ncbi:MAG: caspase family protein [Saprospiraceae bacterium]
MNLPCKLRSVWIVFAVLCLAFVPKAHATKRALLVAVGNYPVESGWKSINSGNDINLLLGVLERQGFAAANIAIMRHESATRMGILNAIRTQLLQTCAPGDEVYFHFSGHGQLIADNNGDELDGFDEALVPYDSPMKYQPGVYEGQNLIRDEELGDLFNQIRRKLGPSGQLIVVIDACHSGTGTRGNSVTRGTDVVMADSAWITGHRSRGADNGSDGSFAQAARDGVEPMAPYIAFFGAAPNQLNYETTDDQGRNVGSLSYAWSKALNQATPRTTYRGLFESIRIEMAARVPQQTPMVEGDQDRTLFGGDVVVNPLFFHVNDLDSTTGMVYVNGGWLQGLNRGSVVGFFPPETRDPAHETPIVKGVVEQSGALGCGIKPEQALPLGQLKSAWVYVLEENPGSLRVRVNLKPFSSPLYSQLKETLSNMPVVELNPEAADLIIEQQQSEVLLLTSDDQKLLSMPANSPPAPAEKKLMQQIFAYGQVKFIRNLNVQSRELKLSMEIIPVKIDSRTGAEVARYPISQKTDANGAIVLHENDCIILRVTNTGSIPAYFTLLDLQPDYRMNILLPDNKEAAEDYRLDAGKSIEIEKHPFIIGEPYGAEMFKLVASSAPVDFRPIRNTQGQGTRGNNALSPLEKMFGDTFYNDDTRTRGGKVHRLSAGTVSVFTLPFTIAP